MGKYLGFSKPPSIHHRLRMTGLCRLLLICLEITTTATRESCHSNPGSERVLSAHSCHFLFDQIHASRYDLRMEAEPMLIRLATAEDLADIQTCARAAYAMYVDRMRREPAPMNADFASQIELGQVQAAYCESAFAGYVMFYREGDHLHLENVAVAPAHAGKGIGKKLVAYVEQAARDQGLAAVELYTNEAMTENLKMYPKLGYVETERRRQDGFKRVFFRKPV